MIALERSRTQLEQLGLSQAAVILDAALHAVPKAYREHRLDRRMQIYLAPKGLIIDEIGYLPLDTTGATMLFQLVSARYERGSIILTSNKSFADWGEVMGEPIIAAAILDWLLHHSHVVNIRGESYRLREKKRAGLPVTPYPRTGESGVGGSDFKPGRVKFQPAKVGEFSIGLDSWVNPQTSRKPREVTPEDPRAYGQTLSGP